MEADLVVVTGDLVQRAHRWQYRHAAAVLQAFTAPCLVVPGNHDLYSWIYRPWMRIGAPLGRYKRQVSADLSPVWEGRGVCVLGLNTATPWTIQRGRCTAAHARRIQRYFDAQPSSASRVLAVHHPLARVDLPCNRDIAQGAEQVLLAAARAGVDLILCGHWHLSKAQEAHIDGKRIVIAMAGTATSRRYRKPQIGLNAFNVVELYTRRITVEEWRYSPAENAFMSSHTSSFG